MESGASGSINMVMEDEDVFALKGGADGQPARKAFRDCRGAPISRMFNTDPEEKLNQGGRKKMVNKKNSRKIISRNRIIIVSPNTLVRTKWYRSLLMIHLE